MKKILVIITMISFVIAANGQSSINLYNDNSISSLPVEQFTQKQDQISLVNYFLNDDWQGGLIQLRDNREINGYLFRYNIFTDQIELKSVIDPSPVEIISIGGRKFIFSDFIVNESSINSGYFELIVNGDCKLLVRRYIRSNEQNYRVSKILGSGSTAPSTTIIKDYYIKKGLEPAVLLDKMKGSLLKYLSDKRTFQEYLNKKHILLINEKKLIELINYYNKI